MSNRSGASTSGDAQSRTRYERMMASARLIAAEVDRDGVITYVNENACALVGRTASEVVGTSFLEFVVEHERPGLAAAHVARMTGEATIDEVPMTVVHRDGSTRRVHFHTSVLHDDAGRACGAVVLGEDITEREELERRLSQKAEDLDSIFRLTRDLFFRLSKDDVIEDYVAPIDIELLVPPEHFLHRPLLDTLPPGIAGLLAAGVTHARETQGMQLVLYDVETPEGATEHWEGRLLPMPDGGTSVIARDVTARVTREIALHESENRYHAVVDSSPYAIYIVDFAGVVLMANPAAAKLLGAPSPEALRGVSLMGLLPDRDGHCVTEATSIAERMRSLGPEDPPPVGEPTRCTTRTLAGETIDIERTVSGFWLDGEATLLVISRDITAELAAAEALAEVERQHQERLRELGAQLSVAEDRERRRLAEELHDRVSQSLAVARMHLSMADDGCDTEATAQHLASARKLIEEAIGETRAITTELAPPVLYELGLGAGLRWIVDRVEESSDLPVDLALDFDESALDVEAKVAVFRACRELLFNAVKHAAASSARVELRDDPRGHVVLVVQDDGCGFTADDTGLAPDGFGLFSIRERMLGRGGAFTLDSAPGRGTRAEVSLPLQRV